MRYDHFPMKYLGCPLHSGRKKLSFYSDMVTKVVNRIRGWHLKFLSFGGRATLIRHVLRASNIHTLAAVDSPKGTIDTIEKYITRFFWSGTNEVGKHHWVSWYNLCFPFEEGGANFRRLEDISLAFHAKQWWKFRTTNTIWSNFMKFKYADNIHPLTVNWAKGNSYSWKAMCDVKERVDSNILWYIGRENISFWFDTWSNIGTLYKKVDGGLIHQNLMLNEVLIDGHWDWSCLQKQPIVLRLLSIFFAKATMLKKSGSTLLGLLELLSGLAKYSMERRSTARSISLISFNIVNNLKSNFGNVKIGDEWSDICNLSNIPLDEVSIIAVKWIKPPILFVKLNSDGSCVNGECGARGVIRDCIGNFMMAFSKPLGQGTSNWAEACALLFGSNWCIQKGHNLIIGETDSLLLQNCVTGTWPSPWRIANNVRQLKTLVHNNGIIIRHCFKEANRVADRMASLSHKTVAVYINTNFETLPRQVKGLLNTDRWNLPTFRVMKRKPSKLIYEPP
ncbi:putative ribonuclease h protein [Nicotiana attenuata]|uniref:Ribonuclease h protein n=1 Tax=Nicotiana attenuata TaxID=49451 RepID=A0A314L8B4_NICAT|nr:putative ribonuclease h protein [Nicotiana attenuata]